MLDNSWQHVDKLQRFNGGGGWMDGWDGMGIRIR